MKGLDSIVQLFLKPSGLFGQFRISFLGAFHGGAKNFHFRIILGYGFGIGFQLRLQTFVLITAFLAGGHQFCHRIAQTIIRPLQLTGGRVKTVQLLTGLTGVQGESELYIIIFQFLVHTVTFRQN